MKGNVAILYVSFGNKSLKLLYSFGKYFIRHDFRVQIFSRFWTRCGNSRGINFVIF